MIKQKRACSKSISPAPDTELHRLRALRIASSTPSVGDIGSFGPSRIHPRHYVWYQYRHSDALVGLRASVKPKSTSQAFGIHRETPYEPIVSPQSLSCANTPTDYTSCMTAWSFRAIIAAILCHDWWPPSLNHGLWSTKAYVRSLYMSRSTSRSLLPVRNRAIDTMCGRSQLEYYLPLPFRQSETLRNWQLSKSRATSQTIPASFVAFEAFMSSTVQLTGRHVPSQTQQRRAMSTSHSILSASMVQIGRSLNVD